MRPEKPAEFFVVLEACTQRSDLGCRTIIGPKQERIVLSDKSLEDVAFDYEARHLWRPGDYKTRMYGWKTLAGAERFARKFTTLTSAQLREKHYRGGVRVYQLMIDTVGGAEDWVLAPVECGASNTADRERAVTDRDPGDEDPRA